MVPLIEFKFQQLRLALLGQRFLPCPRVVPNARQHLVLPFLASLTRQGLEAGHWPMLRATPPAAAAAAPSPRTGGSPEMLRPPIAEAARTAPPPMITELGSTPRQLLAHVMLFPLLSLQI